MGAKMFDVKDHEAPDFKIFSGLLKAVEADDGRKHVHAIASSTVKDLHGDTMQLTAIESMARSAKENMTIWLNHEYAVPEDVFGSVTSSAIRSRALDANGGQIYDLDFDIVVSDTNPRALETWEAIKSGVKLGVSIGAMLKDYVLNKDGTFEIVDVELLEASIVGIPANPRSWIQNAVRVAKSRQMPEMYGTTSSAESATFTLEVTADEEELEEIELSVDPDLAKPKDLEPGIDAELDVSVADDEPESPAQEAPSTEKASAPENEEAVLDETADGDDEVLGDTVTETVTAETKSVVELVDALRMTTAQLVEAHATTLRLTAERDLAVKGFLASRDILDKVAALPLARKSQSELADLRQGYDRLSGVYGEDFLKMLEKTDG
jgi:phage head maturation protease